VNELSQLTNTERIVLSLAEGYQYSDVWLSSLDDTLPGGVESGRMYWGNDLNTILASPFQSFMFPAFGGSLVEGQLALTSPAGVASSRLLAFVPGNGVSTTGANEDYLVWGVGATATSVPDGGSAVALLGLGLLGLSTLRRKFGSR
jgi:hypothetical protein